MISRHLTISTVYRTVVLNLCGERGQIQAYDFVRAALKKFKHKSIDTFVILQNRVVNGPEPEVTSPNPDRARHLFLKPDLGPEAKFTE